MLIIQDQLPYNTNVNHNIPLKSKKKQPLLPQFNFKEKQDPVEHDDTNCENCGTKPIKGNLYKCANCEDYNLCEACYLSNKYDHFSYHIFMKMHKA